MLAASQHIPPPFPAGTRLSAHLREKKKKNTRTLEVLSHTECQRRHQCACRQRQGTRPARCPLSMRRQPRVGRCCLVPCRRCCCCMRMRCWQLCTCGRVPGSRWWQHRPAAVPCVVQQRLLAPPQLDACCRPQQLKGDQDGCEGAGHACAVGCDARVFAAALSKARSCSTHRQPSTAASASCRQCAHTCEARVVAL
jgi:hypothetical protein